MTRHARGDKVLHLLLGHGLTLLEDDARHDLFAVVFIGNADDLYVGYLGIGVDEFFDLLGIDILTAADDHIL